MERVQRRRIKGFKLPENTKCVNRGTKWGNPFKIEESKTGWVIKDQEQTYGNYQTKTEAHLMSVSLYEEWTEREIRNGRLNIEELRGKNLACFCALDMDCHADYLLRIANV
jgi:hypothetical protein